MRHGDEPICVKTEGSQGMGETLGPDEMEIRDTTVGHEHQKT